jgi:hypothetical protein
MRCPSVYMDGYGALSYEEIEYEDYVARVRILELHKNSERLDWNLGPFDGSRAFYQLSVARFYWRPAGHSYTPRNMK